MKLSILERLLVVERHRPRMASVGEFSAPVAMKVLVQPSDAPWVTTLSTGAFVQTRQDREGLVGHAMFECPIEEEDIIFSSMYTTLCKLSRASAWENRCGSIAEAVQRMKSFGLEPKTLTVPYITLSDVVGEELSEEEVEKVTLSKGCVTEVDGIRVLSARSALPPKAAILTAHPTLVGRYVRIQDYLGVVLFRASSAMVLVENALAG